MMAKVGEQYQSIGKKHVFEVLSIGESSIKMKVIKSGETDWEVGDVVEFAKKESRIMRGEWEGNFIKLKDKSEQYKTLWERLN